MTIYIVIPAHNEEAYIGSMLESLINQSFLPKKVVIVNDNSTDRTAEICAEYSKTYDWIETITNTSSAEHRPGSKVIHAFYKGLNTLDNNYDIICKFDADIILPNNYLESIVSLFKSNSKIGIAGGLAYIKKGENWIYETIASKDHVRGPFKAYRKACFNAIGGLKQSIGWDTIDVLLAKYHGWEVQTIRTLHVKHLKPTGKTYHKSSRYLQGEAFYKMRMGISITIIAALKSAINKKSIPYFFNTLIGYIKAKNNNTTPLVTPDEGKFIRQLRWNGILKKLHLK